METPKNTRKIIYDRLKNDSDMNSFVSGRIFPNVVPKDSAFPAVIYQRITPAKIDFKWLVNEYWQISVWDKKENLQNLDLISKRIIQLFNWAKITDTKSSVVKSINETYNPETGRIGIHASIHIKVLDVTLIW